MVIIKAIMFVRRRQSVNIVFILKVEKFTNAKNYQERDKQIFAKTTAAGFEPTREFPNGFLVHHLNRSVKQPILQTEEILQI